MPHIEEDGVVVGVAIAGVNAVKALWELHKAAARAAGGVHEEAHSLTQAAAVVHVVIAVKIEDEWRVGQHGRHSHLQRKQLRT